MKQDAFKDEKKALREVRKRIRNVMANATETNCQSDWYVANGAHGIHFKIRSKDGYLEGHVTVRVS